MNKHHTTQHAPSSDRMRVVATTQTVICPVPGTGSSIAGNLVRGWVQMESSEPLSLLWDWRASAVLRRVVASQIRGLRRRVAVGIRVSAVRRSVPSRALCLIAAIVLPGAGCGQDSYCEQVAVTLCELADACDSFPTDSGTPADPNDDFSSVDHCVETVVDRCAAADEAADIEPCLQAIDNLGCVADANAVSLPDSCTAVALSPRIE